MSIYKKASKQKLRITTNRGVLSVEQLWDLPISELDTLAVHYEAMYKKSGKKSFLEEESKKDKEAKLRFDVILDVLRTKVETSNRTAKANETRAHNQKISEVIQRKKEGALEDLSIEELEKKFR